MKNLLLVVVSFIAISLGATVAVLLQQPDISTLEIDRDRAAVAAEIAAARLEDEKYAGGLIKAFLGVRISILQNTLAMLDQKRASLVRRIALNYTLEGKSIKPASDDELNVILEELTQAEKKSAQSKSEASQYSGGLLQSMKLIKL